MTSTVCDLPMRPRQQLSTSWPITLQSQLKLKVHYGKVELGKLRHQIVKPICPRYNKTVLAHQEGKNFAITIRLMRHICFAVNGHLQISIHRPLPSFTRSPDGNNMINKTVMELYALHASTILNSLNWVATELSWTNGKSKNPKLCSHRTSGNNTLKFVIEHLYKNPCHKPDQLVALRREWAPTVTKIL